MIREDVLSKGLSLVAVLFLLSASTVLGQPPCEGDLNCDGQVTGADTVMYKADYNRTPYLNEPCPGFNPRCQPTLVPKTGAVYSNRDGDDGDLQKGYAWPNPRFTDNGDGTVTDNLTNLVWLKDANCFGTRTWNLALSDSNGTQSGLCGLTDGSNAGDWRLPNLFELESLRDMKYIDRALPNTAGSGQWSEGDPFTNLQINAEYWTSNFFAPFAAVAWFIAMGDGLVNREYMTHSYYVLPVRGSH